ncbi:MAG: chorismate mutase [Polyangiaceae bacterium]|nr:chorismate mutase [Polyangiaceae bacterium]
MAETTLEIDELRRQMAQVDARLVALLDERARAARRIGELRRDQAPVLPLTDRTALEALVSRSPGDMPAEPLRRVLGTVYAECLALELPTKVAVAGDDGGPAHAAARGRFGTASAATTLVESAAEALDAVSRRRADFAVAPLETTDGGPVYATLSALLASDLRVVEVLEIPVDLVVANRSGALDGIDRVHGTAPDLAGCRRVLGDVLPRASHVEARSALAACLVAREDGGSAALALEATAIDAGLTVARRGLLDAGGQRMRAAVLGMRPSGRTGRELTSFGFTLRDGPGALVDVIGAFAERGIPLAKIHSHPSRNEAWSYVFFGEAVGHFTDRPLVMAFEEVKRLTRSFKLLGSYPAP